MKDWIQVGDVVQVNFNGSQQTMTKRAKVLYIPQATGDSWHFRDEASGDLIYVSEGCTIIKLEDKVEFQP